MKKRLCALTLLAAMTLGVNGQTINGHEYVDLGLSVRWATCNVGAESPEDYGDYYAWGETRTKSSYDISNCETWEKDIGDIENTNRDVAHVKWGGSWRMPTTAELRELLNKCTWTWTTRNGVNGYKVTGKNGNYIFLPAAGWRDGKSLRSAGKRGHCWSSTCYGSYTLFSYFLGFDGGGHNLRRLRRSEGRSVRPVAGIAEGATPVKKTKGIINGHGYVDLGLSVKWASCNIGANTPEEYGNYYAWGETNTKSSYDISNCETYEKDIGDIKGTSRDVAHVKWGGTWRMPTTEDFDELLHNCTWTWTTQNGVKGYKVTGKNGNSIFLPAAGWREGTSFYDAGSYGLYWSSMPLLGVTTTSGDYAQDAYVLDFVSNRRSNSHFFFRGNGYPVRPVAEESAANMSDLINMIQKYKDYE